MWCVTLLVILTSVAASADFQERGKIKHWFQYPSLINMIQQNLSQRVCPPPPGPVCPQICPPPPPLPPCRPKPIMRGLLRKQTTGILAQAFALAALGGSIIYVTVALPRRARYKDFYAKAEIEEWADEMARKGLFQSVPLSSFIDDSDKKKS